VAEVRGEPAAEVCAEQNLNALLGVLAARGWPEARVEALLERSAAWEAVDEPETPGAWIIEWVAAAPANRRAGLVRRLPDDALARGAELEHRVAELRVALGNTPAIAAYEKAGFRAVALHLGPKLDAAIGLAGVVCMQRPPAVPARAVA
jgi:ribosomal protein S18 acetylase RimI-like enzyme